MNQQKLDLLLLQKITRNAAATVGAANALLVRAAVATILNRYHCATVAECERKLTR